MSQMPPVQPGYQGPVPGASKPAGLAVTSMVLGIVSLVLFCVIYVSIPCAIIAVVLGSVARGKVKRGEGGGMAMAGLVCGCIAIVVAVLWVVFIAAMLGYGGDALNKAIKEQERQNRMGQGGTGMFLPNIFEHVSAVWNITSTFMLK